jgi:hypothetical protein
MRTKSSILLRKVSLPIVSLIEEINLRSTSLGITSSVWWSVLVLKVIKVLSLVWLFLSAGRTLPLLVLIEVWPKLATWCSVTLQSLYLIWLEEVCQFALNLSLRWLRKRIWIILIALALSIVLLSMRSSWPFSNYNIYQTIYASQVTVHRRIIRRLYTKLDIIFSSHRLSWSSWSYASSLDVSTFIWWNSLLLPLSLILVSLVTNNVH